MGFLANVNWDKASSAVSFVGNLVQNVRGAVSKPSVVSSTSPSNVIYSAQPSTSQSATSAFDMGSIIKSPAVIVVALVAVVVLVYSLFKKRR